MGLFTKKKIRISDEKLDAVMAVLTTVGLSETDDWGFANRIRNPNAYWTHTFAWTQALQGTRFYVEKDRNDFVQTIRVVQHGPHCSEEEQKAISKANEALELIFSA